MSTSYYRLKPPVTYLRIEDQGSHNKISVWVSHGLSGALVVSKRETHAIVDMFTLHEKDSQCPLRTHWAGASRGTVVTINDDTLADEICVVSEYGELLTVGEVKARDGAKRSDGMPTELFGYEKAASITTRFIHVTALPAKAGSF